MFNYTCIRSDMKRMLKDTILMPLLIAPVIISIVFKIGYCYGVPWIINRFGIDFSLYSGYILAMVVSFIPIMLGIIMGFMMIEDKDDNIIQLFMVTPMEIEGYLINRMIIIGSFSFVYTFISYFVLSIHSISFIILLTIAICNSIFSVAVGMFFFSMVSDKIKGLTYAKGFNLLSFFIFAPFIKSNLFSFLAYFMPTFWLGRVIVAQKLFNSLFLILISIFWSGIIYYVTKKKMTT